MIEEAFWNQFEHADTFGALIHPDASLARTTCEHAGGRLAGQLRSSLEACKNGRVAS